MNRVSRDHEVTVIELGPSYDSLDDAALEETGGLLLGEAVHAEPPRLLLDLSGTRFIGSRFIEREGFQSTPMRRVGIRVFMWLTRLTSGRRIQDTTSGFRAYNRKVLAFLAERYPSDYPEVESITMLSRNRFRIVEIPVTMRERSGGTSSITPGRSLFYLVKVSLASLVSMTRSRGR